MSLSTSTRLAILAALCLVGCSPTATRSTGTPASTKTLTEARADFKTKLAPQAGERTPVEQAPPAIFSTIKYPAASGQLAAYLTPDPSDGKKHPAIIWITGGDCNSIGDVWSPAPPENDQTAAAFRNAGIVMMFPSLRGGNDNPGAKAILFGTRIAYLRCDNGGYLEKRFSVRALRRLLPRVHKPTLRSPPTFHMEL